MDKPRLFIATPMLGSAHPEYCVSIVRLVQHLGAKGIAAHYATIDGSATVAEKRDQFAATFLRTNTTSHLLFVDSDMSFDPALAEKLLGFDKDVIGTVYARRGIDLAAYAKAHAAGSAPLQALALAHSFLFAPDDKQRIEVNGELARVGGLGAGFLLVSRRCIETMSAKAATYTSYRGETVADLFGPIAQGTRRMGEDLAFCRRWRETGGEVWAYINATIWHCGTMSYGVPFAHFLAAKQKVPDQAAAPPTETVG